MAKAKRNVPAFGNDDREVIVPLTRHADGRLTVAADATTKESGGKVLCAVLCDCVYGKHNDILELDAEVAEAAHAAGYVDTHPNAIKAIREGK